MAPPPAPTHAELTTAEIVRLQRDYNTQRAAAVAELVKIEQRANGAPPAPPLSDEQKQVRQKALQLINGYAPAADWALPKDTPRDVELRVEIAALDMVVDALGQKWTRQKAIEATQWLDAHGDEWTRLVREILLTATRLAALEAKASAMRAAQGMYVSLPLVEHIGSRSVVGANWSCDPAGAAVRAALAAKIVSPKDLEQAKDV